MIRGAMRRYLIPRFKNRNRLTTRCPQRTFLRCWCTREEFDNWRGILSPSRGKAISYWTTCMSCCLAQTWFMVTRALRSLSILHGMASWWLYLLTRAWFDERERSEERYLTFLDTGGEGMARWSHCLICRFCNAWEWCLVLSSCCKPRIKLRTIASVLMIMRRAGFVLPFPSDPFVFRLHTTMNLARYVSICPQRHATRPLISCILFSDGIIYIVCYHTI